MTYVPLPYDRLDFALTDDELEAIESGHVNASVVRKLVASEYDLLHQRLASIVELAGDLLPAGAISLLHAAHEADPLTYAQTLRYPYVAVWATSAYDLLMRSASTSARHSVLAHFSRVAAAVAVRCGLNFELPVISDRSGLVAFPSVGAFRSLPANTEQAVRARDGCLEFAGVPRAEWLPLHRVRTEANGLTLSLTIDDLDHYRGSYELAGAIPPADRLDSIASKNWREMIEDSWLLVATHHRMHAESIAAGLQVVTPMLIDRPTHCRSPHGFGSIAMAGIDPGWVAYALIDEFKKSQLSALHAIVELHTCRKDEEAYLAPWRPHIPITFRKYFETTFAMPANIDFWHQQQTRAVDTDARINASMLNAMWRQRLPAAREDLLQSGLLTDRGRKVVELCRAASATTPVSPELEQAAAFTERDFLISLRLECRRPTGETVEFLLSRWKGEEPQPPRFGLEPAPAPDVLSGWRTRRHLLMRKVGDPEWFEHIRTSDHLLHMIDESADSLDSELVAGNADLVVSESCKRIRQGVATLEDWARLASAHIGDTSPGGVAFVNAPETVFALHRRIAVEQFATPEPVAVAIWLSQTFSATEIGSTNPFPL